MSHTDDILQQSEAVTPIRLLSFVQHWIVNEKLFSFVEHKNTAVFLGPCPTEKNHSTLKNKYWVSFGRELAEDESVPKDAYVVGEQPYFIVKDFIAHYQQIRSLRHQIQRARNKQVQIHHYRGVELNQHQVLKNQIDELLASWFRQKHLPPLSFAGTVAPFENISFRDVFVATHHDKVIAVAFGFPLQQSKSFIVDHMIRAPQAPNGTTELLFISAMQHCFERNIDVVTLGLCPLAGRVPRFLELFRRFSRGLYDFQGLYEFKSKFRPNGFTRVVVEHPQQSSVMGTIRVLRAFAGNHFGHYAIDTAKKMPPTLLRLIGILLIPWILFFMRPQAGPLFPNSHVQLFWVLFDILLLVLFFLLAKLNLFHRLTRRVIVLHFALATLVTADSLATLYQLAVHNLNMAISISNLIFSGISAIAPAFVALLLWLSFFERLSIFKQIK